MSEPLSQQAFEYWRQEHDKKMDLVVGFLATQGAINLDVIGRVAAVEAKQEECEAYVSRRTTWISSVVAAAVGGITAWFVK